MVVVMVIIITLTEKYNYMILLEERRLGKNPSPRWDLNPRPA